MSVQIPSLITEDSFPPPPPYDVGPPPAYNPCEELAKAIKRGDHTVLEALVKDKGLISRDLVFIDGRTPVDQVVDAGDSVALGILLANGFRKEQAQSDPAVSSVMHRAAAFGQPEIIRLLVSHKFALNSRCTDRKNTPLIVASFFQQPDSVRALLECGADRTLVNSDGETACMVSSGLYDRECQQILGLDEYSLEIMMRKLIGHFYGLSYTSHLDGREIPLEGFRGGWLISRALGRHLPEFFKSNASLFSPEQEKQQAQAFENASKERSAAEIFEDIEKKIPVVIFTGWEGHVITLTLLQSSAGSYLVIGNRGEEGAEGQTIKAFRIDPKKLTLANIEWLLKICKDSETKDLDLGFIRFYATIPIKFSGMQDLSQATDKVCEFLESLSPSFSKTGVCTFASGKTSLLAMQAFFKLEEKICGNWDEITEKELGECRVEVKDVYKREFLFLRGLLLTRYMQGSTMLDHDLVDICIRKLFSKRLVETTPEELV